MTLLPVATLSDLHTCPYHGEGAITDAGQSIVKIDGIPVAVTTGTCTCSQPDDNPMVLGALTVNIDGKNIMRMGDQTSHGGVILTGKPTVTIA